VDFCLIFGVGWYNGGTFNFVFMIPYDDSLLTPAEIAEIELIARTSPRFSAEEAANFMQTNKSLSYA
jgi:hypothetical protein